MAQSSLGNVITSYGAAFGSTEPGVIERSFVVIARRFRSVLLHLVDGLAAGDIDLSEFIRTSNGALRTAFANTYLLGSLSVDSFHSFTVRDMRLINREIEEERHFLKQFGQDLNRGFYSLDPVSRAGLYLQALRGMFELGRSEAIVGPLIWKLGPTEHCIPCLSASLSGPYQRDQFSHLGLPVLPGIPGIGDICDGLTKCGCTITGLNPLPNQVLQNRIRELLVEMIHDTS